MARRPGKNDFTVDVEGIGQFVFGRRTLADEIRIQTEYSRITEGVMTPTPFLFSLGSALAALRVLTVKAPEDWEPEAMDPLDEGTFKKIEEVFVALRDREETFRKGRGAGGETEGQESGEDDGVLAEKEVQPPAE